MVDMKEAQKRTRAKGSLHFLEPNY